VLANGLVVVVALAVAFAGAELVLRFVFRSVQSAADDRTYFARRQAEHNSLGFREREFDPVKPPDTYRIAVVGDSLAWGIGVAPAERFSGQIEQALNGRRRSGRRFEVLNFSHAGWDTADELQALRMVVLQTGADFVVLQWYLNDFENGVRVERPKPAPLLPWEPLRLWLFHASALYSVLEEKWVRVQEWLGAVPTYPEYMYRRFGDPRSPHSADAVGSLRAFIAECRQRGVRVTVILFPHPGPDLVAGRYEYDYLHDRVMETCHGEGIDCVDLRSTFAGSRDYRQLWVSPLDPHPSALAHRLAAERLLDAFEQTWLTGS
jgi:lysophospholipase L1-like esterase